MLKASNGDFFAKVDPVTDHFGLRWSKFSTHVAVSDNKFARDRYVKVNGQSIYSGSLNRFGRAVAVRNLHQQLSVGALLLKGLLRDGRVDVRSHQWNIEMKFQAHAGYGSVAMRKTKKGYVISGGDDVTEPNWDMDNQWIWMKLFQDTCVKCGVMDTDTVKRIVQPWPTYVPCDTFDQRSLTFVFRPAQPR